MTSDPTDRAEGWLVLLEVSWRGPKEWPWWKPGYFRGRFVGRVFRRIWWGPVAIAWIRGNLKAYGDDLRSGLIEWRK